MTVDRGKRAPDWVAAYLRRWRPSAEKTPNSRPGPDLLGTADVKWEVKTCREWRPREWMAQAAKYAGDDELAVLVYLPPGTGRRSVASAMACVPLEVLMPLLVAAGYAPAPFRQARP